MGIRSCRKAIFKGIYEGNRSACRYKDKRKACGSSLRMRGIFDIRPLVTLGIAAVLYVFMALICGKSPFGSYSFLLSDLKPNMRRFSLCCVPNCLIWVISRAQALPTGCLIHSVWGSARIFSAASDTTSKPAQSPVSAFDVSRIDAFVLMLVIVKLSVSSSFMCLFLTTRTDSRKSYFPVLLGLIYGFSLMPQLTRSRSCGLTGISSFLFFCFIES